MSGSASGLILLQVSTRLLTFVLTQSLVRLSSPAVFGLANIHLDLVLSTVLFLSREGVRGALLRTSAASGATAQDDDDDDKSASAQRAAQNVALLPVPLGILLSLLSSHIYITHLAPSNLATHVDFRLSVQLYILGAVLEILSEPLYTRAQSLGNVSLRIRAEGASVLLKCVTTLATIVFGSTSGRDLGLVAFGVGQAAYGATTLAIFALHFLSTTGSRHTLALLTPSRKPLPPPSRSKAATAASEAISPWLDQDTLRLSGTLSKQSVVKHLLTEADKLAVAKLAGLSDQGAYALASNYGSLLARLLLQPLEESLRLSTSRRLNVSPIQLGELEESANRLKGTLSIYIYLFSFVVVFCPPLSLPVLLLVAGPRWALETSAPSLLAVYGSVLLPSMSLNGVLEGFLQSTADAKTLGSYDKVLVGASGVFGASLWGLSRAGLARDGAELVWANAANLLTRAAWGWSYMREFYHQKAAEAGQSREKGGIQAEKGGAEITASTRTSSLPFQPSDLLPSLPATATFVLSSALLNASALSRVNKASLLAQAATLKGGRVATVRLLISSPLREHLALSIACLGACLASCFLFERRKLRGALQVLRS